MVSSLGRIHAINAVYLLVNPSITSYTVMAVKMKIQDLYD